MEAYKGSAVHAQMQEIIDREAQVQLASRSKPMHVTPKVYVSAM